MELNGVAWKSGSVSLASNATTTVSEPWQPTNFNSAKVDGYVDPDGTLQDCQPGNNAASLTVGNLSFLDSVTVSPGTVVGGSSTPLNWTLNLTAPPPWCQGLSDCPVYNAPHGGIWFAKMERRQSCADLIVDRQIHLAACFVGHGVQRIPHPFCFPLHFLPLGLSRIYSCLRRTLFRFRLFGFYPLALIELIVHLGQFEFEPPTTQKVLRDC